MRILLTGSSGWLGRHLAPRLIQNGHDVVGLDPAPGPHTSIAGSVADRALVERALDGVEAVIHGGGLHQPDMARHPTSAFVDVNVQGTLNVLEASIAAGVKRLVFTSTTSLMISAALYRAGRTEALWIDETLAPLEPRNIYGVTKLAAEQLCRMTHEQSGLPIVVLRTSRFFPEDDNRALPDGISDENAKANEMLNRRLTPEDAAEAHVAALAQADAIGFEIFIVSATPPFAREDCAELMTDAPSVVARRYPRYREIYARLGWRMAPTIDRVYDPSRAAERLGFRCRTGFGEWLTELEQRLAAAKG